MNETPISGNYKVVVISPRAVSALSKAKNVQENQNTKDNKALGKSLDGLSSIMQAKVKPKKKKPDAEDMARLQELAKQKFIDEMAEQICVQQGEGSDCISKTEARDMVNTLIEDGTLENMYKEAVDDVRETLGDVLQNMADEAIEKGHIVSLSDLEEKIDDLEKGDDKKPNNN